MLFTRCFFTDYRLVGRSSHDGCIIICIVICLFLSSIEQCLRIGFLCFNGEVTNFSRHWPRWAQPEDFAAYWATVPPAAQSECLDACLTGLASLDILEPKLKAAAAELDLASIQALLD